MRPLRIPQLQVKNRRRSYLLQEMQESNQQKMKKISMWEANDMNIINKINEIIDWINEHEDGDI